MTEDSYQITIKPNEEWRNCKDAQVTLTLEIEGKLKTFGGTVSLREEPK